MWWRWRRDRKALGAYLRSAAAGIPDAAMLQSISDQGAGRIFDAWLDDEQGTLLAGKALPVVGPVECAELWAQAVGAIARRHAERFVDCVQETGERSSDTTAAMLTVLSQIPDARAVDVLIAGAGHGDRQVRLAAVEGLGRRDERRVLPLIERALQDPDHAVALAATEALATWDRERAAVVLNEFRHMRHLNPVLAARAAHVLNDLHASRPVPAAEGAPKYGEALKGDADGDDRRRGA